MGQPKLTSAQCKRLEEIRREPGVKYNGRARKPIEALRKLGLIRFEFDLDIGFYGFEGVTYTCWPIESGRDDSTND